MLSSDFQVSTPFLSCRGQEAFELDAVQPRLPHSQPAHRSFQLQTLPHLQGDASELLRLRTWRLPLSYQPESLPWRRCSLPEPSCLLRLLQAFSLRLQSSSSSSSKVQKTGLRGVFLREALFSFSPEPPVKTSPQARVCTRYLSWRGHL